MKPLFSIALGLTLGSSAWANTLTCTSSDGELHYYKWLYSGGAHPMRGMMVAREKLVHRDALLGKWNAYYRQGADPITWSVTFDENARKELAASKDSASAAGVLVYSVPLTAKRIVTGGGLSSEEPAIRTTVVCTYQYDIVPRP